MITAEQYDAWSADQCADLEIVEGELVRNPPRSKREQRLRRTLANALDAAAGPDWIAGTGIDLRLQDVPLTNRRPDVVVYRADTIDVFPTRPEHTLLVVDFAPSNDRATQYAKAGIAFYWRVEQAATGVPIVYTYVLDPASRTYRDSEVFTGEVKATAPFPVAVQLTSL
ncbi:Uma2 family endonuclease [Kribbella sp. NPDC005582]|uniref:Uma2 family endonuclease n=1 Tax=Kribbella sp. NPDC005582 TaxID=3156893 RepID=UPI0033AD68C5